MLRRAIKKVPTAIRRAGKDIVTERGHIRVTDLGLVLKRRHDYGLVEMRRYARAPIVIKRGLTSRRYKSMGKN